MAPAPEDESRRSSRDGPVHCGQTRERIGGDGRRQRSGCGGSEVRADQSQVSVEATASGRRNRSVPQVHRQRKKAHQGVDSQRAKECALLTEAQERLERLVNEQSRAPTIVHPPDLEEQVTSPQQMVSCEGAARSQMWGRQNVQVMVSMGQDLTDTHEQRIRKVRHALQRERRGVQLAANSIRLLAERVGPCDMADIPWAIRSHQWSALNVPLMWAAAAGDRSHPVLQWLLEVAATIPEVTGAGIDLTQSRLVGVRCGTFCIPWRALISAPGPKRGPCDCG